MTPYSIGIIWLFFLKGMNSLGFVLLPHTLNNVPLFAEEDDFFPRKVNFSNFYLFPKVYHTSSGNRLRDKSLHSCVSLDWLESC